MKKFKKKCKKIAICLYGQYRTGDYILPYFKKISDAVDCDVEFFCSTKSLNIYYLSQSAHNKGLDKINYIDTKNLEKKILASGIDVKNINIINNNIDTECANYGTERTGLLYSMADSIFLKTLYEHKNNFTYDLVLLTRYDTLITPINILDHLRKWYDTVSYREISDHCCYATHNNWIITEQLYKHEVEGYQDIVLVGSSVSMDMLSTELCYIITNNINIDNYRPPLSENYCGHAGLMQAIHNAGIGASSNYGYINKKKDIKGKRMSDAYSLKKDNSKHFHKGICYTLLRETWDLESMLRKVPLESPKAADYYCKAWLDDTLILDKGLNK